MTPEDIKATAIGLQSCFRLLEKQVADLIAERDALLIDRDEWKQATIDANQRFKTAEAKLSEAQEENTANMSTCKGIISGLTTERDALQAKLSAIEAQEPVGCVDEGEDGLFADLETPKGVMVKRGDKLYAAPVAPAQPEGDAERQERDVAHAHALFSNLKLHGEHSALKAAFSSLWPSAFSHGFQTAKEIYSAKAAQPVDELVEALKLAALALTVDPSGKLIHLDKRTPALIAIESVLAKAAQPQTYPIEIMGNYVGEGRLISVQSGLPTGSFSSRAPMETKNEHD